MRSASIISRRMANKSAKFLLSPRCVSSRSGHVSVGRRAANQYLQILHPSPRTDGRYLETIHGLLAATRAPCQSIDGVLNAIRLAREQNWTYFADVKRFQYTLLEYARNVMGIADVCRRTS